VIVADIVNVMLGVVGWLIGQLPSVSLPSLSGLTTAMDGSGVFADAGWVNWYFPLDTLVLLVGLRWAWMVGEVVWKFILWVVTKLHILGGGAE
jgi:hypothetical protein